MRIKRGIPVSPGVAISQAVVLDAADQPVPRRIVPASLVEHEHERLEQAIVQSRDDVDKLIAEASAKLGAEAGKIFEVHRGLLEDKQLTGQFRKLIDDEHVTAEYAVYVTMRTIADQWALFDNRLLRERAADIWDLERRIIRHLVGGAHEEVATLKHEAVLVAHDLTPSETAALDKKRIKAIATDAGGRTSHTAILAHALGIPAIVGLGDITAAVRSGDTLIIDGNAGVVIIDPDAAQLMQYRQFLQHMAELEGTLDELATLPAETRDGTKINLWGNIEFPDEIEAALKKGATGVGLYRTEFLYLASATEPSEEEQIEAYTAAIRACDGRPLTIRTLDLGADKMTNWQDGNIYPERNPFLGCRSIRLCLQNLPLFKTQLRAILRASAVGPVKIMFPLISNVMELRQARMILSDVMEDLDDQGVSYGQDIPVGIMIEVPSAAIQAATLAREADFFSIGTNDLIQYTVAVDRSNERIASLYSGAHPAVIELLKIVTRAANRAKIEVSLCGEMAGEPEFVMLLLGLGLRNLSVTPPAIPEVKRVIRAVTITQCQRVARKAGTFESDREVLKYLRDESRKVLPDELKDVPSWGGGSG